HLGPLRKYLDSQVGRSWSKVYAEICARVSRDSVVQDHVRDHVDDYVERNVVEIDGTPCHGLGRWYGLPLNHFSWRSRGWYVCPGTGLLRRIPKYVKPPPPEPLLLRISDVERVLRDGDAWFLLTFKRFPKPLVEDRSRHDAYLNRLISRAEGARE